MTQAETQDVALRKIANQLRIHCIRSTTIAGSGHPTSCASAADLVAALFFGKMRFLPQNPHYPNNDRFILSKGHAAPLLYAAWAETGKFDPKQLDTLRRFDSPFEGHPMPRLDFVDVATGSLGQGLSAGVGMALNAKVHHLDYVTYVLMGDGEIAEGSVWEAASFAGHERLSNLVAIVDVNRLGQSGPTAYGWHLETYRARFEAFGWNAVMIDGHDMKQILTVLADAGQFDRPLAIIAQTIKGKGIPKVEDQLDWHGKPIPKDLADQAIAALEKDAKSGRGIKIPEPIHREFPKPKPLDFPAFAYKLGDKVSTRKAFGNALLRIGANERIVALDGDVQNSTYSQEFAKKYPDRFFECYISEQNMVGAASGLAALGNIPFASTFSSFLSRAADQIRMASISRCNLKLVGTHAGLSIGEDGPSQMALEDLGMMRAIDRGIVLSPCDAVSTERLVEKMAQYEGMSYLRAARPDTPVIYSSEDGFEIGGAKLLRHSNQDELVVVATGITVFEALKAQEQLDQQGVRIAVIDAYSIKPLARELILDVAKNSNSQIITVEDHYPEGGLGDAVAGELCQAGIRVSKLAVNDLPRSGKKDELMAHYGIDANAIMKRVRELIQARKAKAA